jgi:hypothetical protein
VPFQDCCKSADAATQRPFDNCHYSIDVGKAAHASILTFSLLAHSQVATWPSYFAQLGLPCPSKPIFCGMLRQYVVSSSKKGYHSAERLGLGGPKALLKLRRQHEPTVRTSWRMEEESTGPEYGQQPWKATAERAGEG